MERAKEEGETKKVQRAEAVEALVYLIAQAKEEQEHAREQEWRKSWRGLGWVWRISLGALSVRDGLGQQRGEDDDDGNRTWESLTSANSLVDIARLHCNIKLEEDQASMLNTRPNYSRRTYASFVLSSRSWGRLQPGAKSISQPPPRRGLGPNTPYHQLGPPIPSNFSTVPPASTQLSKSTAPSSPPSYGGVYTRSPSQACLP